MIKFRLLFTGIILFGGCWPAALAQQADAGFAPASVYAPAEVYSTLEQPDGKRIVSGAFLRANNAPAVSLSCFNPDGTLDANFQRNLGSAAYTYRVRKANNGKIFLTSAFSGEPVIAGGITRYEPLRLNADGTADATFDVGSGAAATGEPGFVNDVVPLPDGRVLVVGFFDNFNGTAANGIVRLTASGAIDPTFTPGSGAEFGDVLTAVALPSGKILIGGLFSSYDGQPCAGVARLNANGTYDPTFTQALNPTSATYNMAVQPDGKVLIAGDEFVGAQGFPLVRLLPNGTVDPSFATPTALPPGSISSFSGDAIQLQADGKIVYISNPNATGATIPGVGRLNADGTFDASFQVGAGPDKQPRTLTLLASGQLLVGGDFQDFSGTADRALAQLSSSGALEPSFLPKLQVPGSITTLLQQADGKVLAGGFFSEVNGQPLRRLARFTANGSLDATFATANSGLSGIVVDLAVQPDGRILAATTQALRRFQATGAPDNSWLGPDFTYSGLTRLMLQPDGRVLVGGNYMTSNGTAVATPLLRLLANGASDNSFTPTSTGNNRFSGVQTFALQPDGKILVAGSYRVSSSPTALRVLKRLEATGAEDASFAGGEFEGVGLSDIRLNRLELQPDGKVLVGGAFLGYNGVTVANLLRVQANGTLDPGFMAPPTTGTIYTLALQPNNRILVGGDFKSTALPTNLARLQPDGQADASFGSTAVPNNAVQALVVQAGGGIVAGGSFSALGSTSSPALGRIVAPNVLAVAAPGTVAAQTQVWPVPARGSLHILPAATAQAHTLELVDQVGRTVQQQPLRSGLSTTLALEKVAPGMYLLRVVYAEGVVTRRVQVQ
ncbi:T9SS type A sorting domain-containing protein [Hymenobacter cellulosilyticus]|uniref:T9SS type A sorting domain-containing protein n=1 Tax=Hymenobacter cellulosilyticus TaxID=2932248 RepID=A0A8T9Q0S9_9BACT|nr:T9SS type A sorting domain-containing protein [Hymenobacter cellulosilyticus]UOQ71044.1 T9SS type A sorting domain-containing protein [Hymenobacter cellulosilyticus]